jgi:hypothetical protein
MTATTKPETSHVIKLLTCASVVITIVAVFYLVTTSSLYRFRTHWGEAESVAADVKRLSENLETLSDPSIRALLDTDSFMKLKSRRIDIKLEPGELVWFRANDMYNVGMVDDGGIRYMRDGKR